MTDEKRYSIGELSELTGVTRRTVRYYVQSTLLPPPLGAGRGHYYTAEHLRRLRAIKGLQEQGFSLEEIGLRLSLPETDLFEEPPAEESPDLWTRVTLAEGVELQVKSGTYRLSPGRLKKLRNAVKDILGPGFKGGPRDKEDDR